MEGGKVRRFGKVVVVALSCRMFDLILPGGLILTSLDCGFMRDTRVRRRRRSLVQTFLLITLGPSPRAKKKSPYLASPRLASPNFCWTVAITEHHTGQQDNKIRLRRYNKANNAYIVPTCFFFFLFLLFFFSSFLRRYYRTQVS